MTPMDFKDRQTVECRVDGLAFGGEGVGRVGGMVVFVEGALPGERAAVEILHRGRKFLRGRAAEILDFSPDRVPPPCRLFGRCGGCALQHLRYESQLDWKRRQVLDILARIGGIEGVPCGAAVPSPAPYGYRNSIRLHRLPGRPPRYGFYCRDNRTLVEVRRCEIAMKAINNAIPGLAKPAGGVRGADEILLRAGADGGVVAHPGRGGARRMLMELGGRRFELHPASFFQVNAPVAATILSRVAAWLDGGGRGGTLFDLHCGVGLFPALLGGRFARIIGIDRDTRAVDCAKRNTAGGGTEAHFFAGDAERLFGGIYHRFAADGSVVILDPPRGGVGEGLIALLAGADRRLARIIYVSCNPATLARDLKRLCAGGAWRVEEVLVCDMFPQTAHVEACCAVGRA